MRQLKQFPVAGRETLSRLTECDRRCMQKANYLVVWNKTLFALEDTTERHVT